MLHTVQRSWRTLRRRLPVFCLAAAAVTAAGCGEDQIQVNSAPTAMTSPALPSQTATPSVPPTSKPTATDTPPPTATATSTESATATTSATATPPAVSFAFSAPAEGQLSLAGPVSFALDLPNDAVGGSLAVELDGAAATAVAIANGVATGTIDNVGAGTHLLTADVDTNAGTLHNQVSFETAALHNPDECDVLNDAECLLPYPSSRFLEPADTPTGFRLNFPLDGMPSQGIPPEHLSPEPYKVLDGYSPTVQILMHFPGGVDVAASNASRLLEQTRTYTTRSLDADSPTILIDADSGERILHFVETDIRATGNPARQVLFLRPGKSLSPGHRYIVAVRHLLHPDGTAVQPEAAFAVLRDDRPTDIEAISSRRQHFEDIFSRLAQAGVQRQDLLLAFDFVVQSDVGLTGQMLSMRDQSFAWLAAQAAQNAKTFSIDPDGVIENDCSTPGNTIWRQIQGTYEVPLFLTNDPAADPTGLGYLNVDDSGNPVQNGFTHPPFTIAIPCTALANDGTPKRPVVIGHGLFGTGRDTISSLIGGGQITNFDYIAGATDWWGLSQPDITPLATSFVVAQVTADLQQFRALPDRLRQGQLNTLVLARMMKTAAFNQDPAFQSPSGTPLLTGPDDEEYYFGASLGGIMGLMFAALSPDVTNANVDVPSINFSLLLQRAAPFVQFEQLLQLTGVTDPMQTVLVTGVIHELWVRGESAGYATHITSNPLPGTNAKNILMTMAWLDQQVSNQGTEITARTLGLPNLEGSLLTNLAQIPDRPGPLSSALVVYDTGSFDRNNPAHQPFIPPLANLQARANHCDPHGLRGYIPASIQQLTAFLQPGGRIENFCHGICDAGDPSEIPFGNAAPCDPLSP